MRVEWTRRASPLEPVGLVAFGPAALALARRLLASSDDDLARLSGAWASGMLTLVAAPEHLPWVDGVVYLGRDDRAPSVLLPTNHTTTVPLELFERALRNRWPEARPPLAVLHDPQRVWSLDPARPIARATLETWLGQERAS